MSVETRQIKKAADALARAVYEYATLAKDLQPGTALRIAATYREPDSSEHYFTVWVRPGRHHRQPLTSVVSLRRAGDQVVMGDPNPLDKI